MGGKGQTSEVYCIKEYNIKNLICPYQVFVCLKKEADKIQNIVLYDLPNCNPVIPKSKDCELFLEVAS